MYSHTLYQQTRKPHTNVLETLGLVQFLERPLDYGVIPSGGVGMLIDSIGEDSLDGLYA